MGRDLLVGALVGLGIPEEEARYYERGLQEGGILVTVDAGARAVEARRILGDAAAEFASTAPADRELGARVRDPWKGTERRRRLDPSYAGPERRLVTT